MAETPAAAQLLSLKVMRVSRPALAQAWEPFYSSSSPFSARSTASVMSLQGKNPLPGHPKTLRDLTHITEMLTLPSAFGAIQLGETFSSCLSVNNESSMAVEGVTLRVEMQTATTKTILAVHGGPEYQLPIGETLETVVHHEIKELGQHVLACTVSYRLPTAHHGTIPLADGQDPDIQSFRKFYKFSVTNPLSVKTKVHSSRAPTALVSATDREKVFLEIHIQNLTPTPVWLQRMRFECIDGWSAEDANLLAITHSVEQGSIFSDSMALLQPQDTRQYVYILSPRTISPFPVNPSPGSIIPLGRLDITWRSSFGEPGRLLTSMLSRRIPLIQASHGPQPPAPPPKQSVSALPLHLQRSNTIGSSTPPRVGSPQLASRPMSPPISTTGPTPYRPGSPFNRSRTATSMSAPMHARSPTIPTSPNPAGRVPDATIEVSLLVQSIPKDDLVVGRPFTISFGVTISASVRPTPLGEPRKDRIVTLAIQHVMPPRPVAEQHPGVPASVPLATQQVWSPKLPSSGFSTPSPYGTPARGDFHDALAERLLMASPRHTASEFDSEELQESGQATPAPPAAREGPSTIILPPPFVHPDMNATLKSYPQVQDVIHVGPSAIFLPPLRAPIPEGPSTDPDLGHERTLSQSTVDSETDSEIREGDSSSRMLMSQDFELQFMPMRSGFATVGGIRVLLVEDRNVDTADEMDNPGGGRGRSLLSASTLKEWDVVAEIWVKATPEQ